jgi:hypothetical protein
MRFLQQQPLPPRLDWVPVKELKRRRPLCSQYRFQRQHLRPRLSLFRLPFLALPDPQARPVPPAQKEHQESLVVPLWSFRRRKNRRNSKALSQVAPVPWWADALSFAARLLSRIVGGCKFVVLLRLVRANVDYALASVDKVEGSPPAHYSETT